MKLFKLVLVVLLIATNCFGFEIEPRISCQAYNDSGLSRGKNYELRLKHKGVFLFGSYDNLHNRFFGQEAGSLDIFGCGAGIEKKISKGISLWISCGYYDPKNGMEGKTISEDMVHKANYEALVRELISRLGDEYTWEAYTYEINPNFGGAVGIDFRKKLTRELLIGMFASYRYLRFNEAIYGRSSKKEGWAEHFMERDYSSYNVGLMFEYKL